MRTLDLSDEADSDLLFPVRLPPQASFTRIVGGPQVPSAPTEIEETVSGGGGGSKSGGGSGTGGPGRRRKRRLKAGGWILLTLWSAAAVGVIGYAARKDIVREIAQAWLKGQDIPSQLRIDSLSFSHISGRAVLGAPDSPDVVLERFDVDFELNPWLKAGQPLARVTKVHLVKPQLVFSFGQKGLSFGALDPLLSRTEPDKTGASVPPDIILVEEAQIRLNSDYGVIKGTGGLSLTKGRLSALEIHLKPSELNGPLAEGSLSAGYIRARTEPNAPSGARLNIETQLSADDLALKPQDGGDPANFATRLQGAHLDLVLSVPYRELGDDASPLAAFDGQVRGTLALRAEGIQSPAADVTHLEANTTLGGRLELKADRVVYEGTSRLLSRMDSLSTGDIDSRSLSLDGADLAVRADLKTGAAPVYSLNGPITAKVGALRQDTLFLKDAALDLKGFSLSGADDFTDLRFEGRLKTPRLVQGDLALEGVDAPLKGEGRFDPQAYQIVVDAEVSSLSGRYAGLAGVADQRARDLAASREAAVQALSKATPQAPAAPLPPEGPDAMVAIARATERFSLKAEGVRLTLRGDGARNDFDLRMARARLLPVSGGEIRLTPRALKPVISSSETGAFVLNLTGGDLPALKVDVFDMGFQGLGGPLKGRFLAEGAFNFAPVYGAAIKAPGRFITTAAGADIRLEECVAFTAERADIGGRMTDVSANLCPDTRTPLLVLKGSQWRAEGVFDALTFKAPDYQANFKDGQGRFAAFTFADNPGLGFTVDLKALNAADALEIPRFHPVALNGTIAQGRKTLDGRIDVRSAQSSVLSRAPDPFAVVTLTSDVATGVGRADITTTNLTFKEGGLQPLDLTPMVVGVMGRNTTGSIDFKGYFGWRKDGSDSGGVLNLENMKFESAAGVAEGLNGRITFTSLSPLNSAPGQTLRVDKLTTFVPLTDLEADLQFAGDLIKLERANVVSPGGAFALEPMDVPFDMAQGFKGALYFDRVDFGKVVEATAFSKDVSFQGRVSGRVPFDFKDGKITFAEGYLKGEGAGRLSIHRAALQDVSTDGGYTPVIETPVVDPVVTGSPIEHMAYQALEHLAYDDLSATIGTDDKGMLGFNFRIQGRYDPPERKEARIGVIDYLRGTWMDKPIDLPSDTRVNLNLGVNYNLDQILSDYVEFQRRKAAL